MKAARLHSYDHDQLQIDDVPEPNIEGPNDVIVRIGGAGLCRTDLHIVEGILAETFPDLQLPYTLGHENAGWVHEVGSNVKNVAVGDAVIVHPLESCGVCHGCRRGEDMYCDAGEFPGLSTNGGFAEYLKTSERALIKLAPGLEPKDVAALADAGITAMRAAKKVAKALPANTKCVVIGVGGLGHIGIQCLRSLCGIEIIAADVNEGARKLAEEVGADHVIEAGDGLTDRVMELTGGLGAEAVLDFVGERGVPAQVPGLLRQGGTYYVVGYGERVEIPNWDFVIREINVVGNLVGNYMDLVELMALAARGKVKLHTQTYKLEDINTAIEDLYAGRLNGRGILIP
ncbi:MAG: NAD(P)-dependent alcohol dehydrogenase [Acidimicrobiia bacterium]